MLSALALLLAAAPLQLVIWSGGTSSASGDGELAKLKAWPFSSRVTFATGYPRVEESAKVAGLKPGFFVVTMGACADEAAAKAFLDVMKPLNLPQGVKPYTRPITDGRDAACPKILTDAEVTAQALAKYQAGCEAGDGAMCLELGWKQSGEARGAAWRKACKLGAGHACAVLATEITSGFASNFKAGHAKGTAQEAGELAERGCELAAERDDCRVAAELFSSPGSLASKGLAPDDAKAAKAWEKYCTVSQQCIGFARMLFDGKGVKKDVPRAMKYWEDDCAGTPDSYRGVGCALAAEAYKKGKGVKKDAAKAESLYTRGCHEHNRYESCEAIGEARPDGD